MKIKDDLIAVSWGIGPSYRKRLKKTIETDIATGYDKTLDYIILTDVPEDFYELRDRTKKIIDIVDIHKEREAYPWSIECEYIPTNQETYGDDYRDNVVKFNKNFTHALERFSIPRVLELGYKKFVMFDPDTLIKYEKIVNGEISEEDFWKKFDCPINTMKGPWKEVIEITENKPFVNSRAIGESSLKIFQFLSLIIVELNKKYNKNLHPLQTKFELTESCLKVFHFESIEFGKQWFEVLNDVAKMCYCTDSYDFRYMSGCGGHMLADFIPYHTANMYMGVEILDFYPDIWWTHIFGDDRYFLPKDNRLKIASNQEEFYEINKDTIEKLKNNHQWPILS
jgi:hypothetical protein